MPFTQKPTPALGSIAHMPADEDVPPPCPEPMTSQHCPAQEHLSLAHRGEQDLCCWWREMQGAEPRSTDPYLELSLGEGAIPAIVSIPAAGSVGPQAALNWLQCGARAGTGYELIIGPSPNITRES